ncbi:PAP2-domain-containing protein, partial [Martensiomyces pterosporus]
MIISYIPDWAVTLVCTLLWAYLGVTKPHYQRFSVNDKSISYPYIPPAEQTVTVPMLFAISIAVPAAIIAVVAFVLNRNMHDLHVGLLGLLLTVSLTLMFTNGLKNVVGRPRPNLLARCLPEMPKEPLSDPPQGLSTIAICTQQDIAVLNEGFRSFPSGHTSLSFAGMTYLTYFLAGKLHIFDRQGHSVKSFVVFLPLLVASIVGATRVSDYWHHPTDVFFGAFLGIVTATFSYHQYYPVLVSPRCDRPFDPR